MSVKSRGGILAVILLPTCLGALWPTPTLGQPTAPHQDAIAALNCGSVSRQGVYGAGWGAGRSPYGIAYEQWTKGDFSALNRRSQECGNFGTIGYVDHLASMARDPAADATADALRQQRTAYLAAQASRREADVANAPRSAADDYAAVEAARRAHDAAIAADLQQQADARRQSDREYLAKRQAEEARQEAEAEAAEKAGRGFLIVDCKDPALLRRVKSTLEQNPRYGGNLSILKLYDPVPNGFFQQLMSGTALQRAIYMRAGFSIPQCDVKAVTNLGQVTLSFRVYKADDETFVEVKEKTI